MIIECSLLAVHSRLSVRFSKISTIVSLGFCFHGGGGGVGGGELMAYSNDLCPTGIIIDDTMHLPDWPCHSSFHLVCTSPAAS